MAEEKKGKVYNHDVVGLIHRWDRYIDELIHSVSSNITATNQFDQNRLLSYLANTRGYISWMIAQPQLDLPESSPKEYQIDPEQAELAIENDDVDSVVRMCRLFRIELINCQSARISAGMLAFDLARLNPLIDKIEKFINDYVAKLAQLDLPESSPRNLMGPPGHTGT